VQIADKQEGIHDEGEEAGLFPALVALRVVQIVAVDEPEEVRCLHESEECVLEVQSEGRTVLVFWGVTHVLVDHLASCLQACNHEVYDEPLLYWDPTVDLPLPQDKKYGQRIAVKTALMFPEALLCLSL
jgi:hypothetical protein